MDRQRKGYGSKYALQRIGTTESGAKWAFIRVVCVCVCVCGVFSYTHHRVVTDFNDNNDFNDYNDYNYYSIRYSCDVYIMHTQQHGKEKQN